MKIGKGWAPEKEKDDISIEASEELKKLLMNIFNSTPKNRLTIRGSQIANNKT